MTVAAIDQFVADNVPERATLPSAIIEHAARARGLDVRRHSNTIVIVRLPAAAISFENLNGPDSSIVGHSFRAYRDGQRWLMTRRGLPVPRSSTFAHVQTRRGMRYAAGDLGWPVTVRPARLAFGKGRTEHVADEAGFQAAWQRAVSAYGDRAARRPVMVEEQVDGERYQLFVVDDWVVSATQRVAASGSGDGWAKGDIVDVTDQVETGVAELATRAVTALPGLAYAGVDITVPTAPGAGGSGAAGPVVTYVDSSPAPHGQFPAHGEPRDIAGAILEHYLNAARWQVAQQTSYQPSEGTRALAAEPLHVGHA